MRRALLATAVAAIIVVVLLASGALSGGSGERKPPAPAKTTGAAPPKQSSGPPLLGSWKGTATQTPSSREPYPAKVRLTVTGSVVGTTAGTLSEKARGQRCKGDLKLLSTAAGHVFRYDENPSPQTGCVDRSTVTVKPSARGGVEFYEIYTAADGNQGTVVGTLRRTGGAP